MNTTFTSSPSQVQTLMQTNDELIEIRANDDEGVSLWIGNKSTALTIDELQSLVESLDHFHEWITTDGDVD